MFDFTFTVTVMEKTVNKHSCNLWIK
jgi:hypothetical protein